MCYKYTRELNFRQLILFYKNVPFKNNNECWEWEGTRSKNRGDYGVFKVWGSPQRATRLMWYLETGLWPGGLWVLHTCDNPPCVNPKHLYLGTNFDNARDAGLRRRYKPLYGEKRWGVKIKDNQVKEIKDRYAIDGMSQYYLAREYKVHQSTINRIINTPIGCISRNSRKAKYYGEQPCA